MKNIKILSLLLIAFIGFVACEQDDDLVFTAQEPAEGINFSNSFLDEYVLTATASSNLGERFTWQDANFGVPTNVTYELENSIIGDFTDATTVGTTNGNELAITIGDMLAFAEAAGLDNDPNTDAPNTGILYFRVKAFIGTEGLPTYSSIQELTVVLPEAVDNSGPQPNCPSIWVVGAGAVDAGWGWDTPVEFLCFDDVYKTNINLINDSFRFFLTEGDWDSGQNHPYYVGEGYTIDSDLVDAMDGDNNFSFIGTPGKYLMTVDTVNKTITLGPPDAEEANCDSVWVVGAGAVDAGWGWDTPIEFSCTDNVYSTNINLINDSFRFFLTEGDWDSGQNHPYYVGEGYIIDANLVDAMDGDNNFSFTGTPGKYLMTVDTVNKTITLGNPRAEEANCDSVWVVGAGAVDAGWGWDTPIEFSCTDGYYSANINLINDSFRFFLTEGDWDSGQNYPFYSGEGYTIHPDLVDAMDGDNNFNFTGTPGNYYLTVDTVNKVIDLR
jgi:ribosomal protein L31